MNREQRELIEDYIYEQLGVDKKVRKYDEGDILDLLNKFDFLRKERATVTTVELIGISQSLIFDADAEGPEHLVLSIYKCGRCDWSFIGDCELEGPPVDKDTEVPNYCPMCGTKIEGVIEE